MLEFRSPLLEEISGSIFLWTFLLLHIIVSRAFWWDLSTLSWSPHPVSWEKYSPWRIHYLMNNKRKIQILIIWFKTWWFRNKEIICLRNMLLRICSSLSKVWHTSINSSFLKELWKHSILLMRTLMDKTLMKWTQGELQ